jgi:hypothetical protein
MYFLTEELISMNGINVETRIIRICNVEICNVTMKLYTYYNSGYEYCNKHTFPLFIGGAFVAGTLAERARTPGAAGRCFSL